MASSECYSSPSDSLDLMESKIIWKLSIMTYSKSTFLHNDNDSSLIGKSNMPSSPDLIIFFFKWTFFSLVMQTWYDEELQHVLRSLVGLVSYYPVLMDSYHAKCDVRGEKTIYLVGPRYNAIGVLYHSEYRCFFRDNHTLKLSACQIL